MHPNLSHRIKFEGFYGYLNYLGDYPGYGGMNWNAMYEVQDSYIAQQGWCNTGYNNALDGHGEAITLGTGGFQSADLGQTFNLNKGTFASAWESQQPVVFNSYTYTYGQGFTLKASDTINLSQYSVGVLGGGGQAGGKIIYFANYGSDFKNISAVTFVSGQGHGGDTCSYGKSTYGYVLVMDDLSYRLNTSGADHEHRPHRQHHAVSSQAAPYLNALFAPAHDVPSHQQTDHHQLQGHDPGGGVTTSFMLPQAEHHFGF